jgi:predicted nucleic acid-binding protein
LRIIFNSSPLIFLARLDFLGKFVDSSDNFYLPKSLADEIEAKDEQPSSYIKNLIDSGNIEVKEVNLVSLANSLNIRLGKGESEAIALSIELQTDYTILDDSAARREAMRLGLKVKGTLSVIKKLNSEGKIIIENLDDLYQKLIEVKFWIKGTLFNEIFENSN